MTALPLVFLLLPATDPPVFATKPLEVRKIYGDGRHNAFTAFVKFQDKYLLAFRTAKEHNSTDGDIVILSSPDTKVWKESARIDIERRDDRDPQFLVAGDKLILYVASMQGPELATYALTTTDGQTWSKPRTVYEPRFIVWKPVAYEDKYYSGSHKKDESSNGKGREVRLIESKDGLTWKTVSTIRAGNWESETTLHFGKGGLATAFLRQKYGSPQAQILEAKPPYSEWTNRPTEVTHFSGHSCHTIDGVTYLLTRERGGPKGNEYGQVIYTYERGKLEPYCRLPAGGDCAYAEVVREGKTMLVTYYSSHEKSTDIYLAVVPLVR